MFGYHIRRALIKALIVIAAAEPIMAFSLITAGSAATGEQRRAAIVIDDFGNGMSGTEDMLRLPVPFTAAVMPFLPMTKRDAEAAHKLHHDVIIHLPMEPKKGVKSWLGPGAITTDLSDGEIRKRVEAAIADVPYAVGMNNHMGSKATADERVMRIVLGVCREHGLFFLDSRTAWKSVIPRIGEELGVPVIRNSVFLDDVYTTSHIAKQLSVFDKRLNEQGTCIAIGHVGPQGKKTAAALSAAIPGLKRSTTFVRASDVVRRLLRDQLIIPNGISDGGGNPLLLARVD